VSAKKRTGIPLERLLLDKGFKRNLDIERRSANRDQRVVDALEEALYRNAIENIAHKDRQSEKAKRPRGRGDDGRTRREIIAEVARLHPDASPEELLPHVNSASEGNGMESITLKTLRNILSRK
jgi:hypothetical protein